VKSVVKFKLAPLFKLNKI